MCRVGRATDALPVSAETRHITIDLCMAGDGIDQPRAFQGWLGLLLALDGLVGTTDEEPAALR